MSIDGASLAQILRGVPYQWWNTVQTFLCCWIEVAAFRTNANEFLVIENKSLSASYTHSVPFIPVLRSVTNHASTIGEHERFINWTGAFVLDSVEQLARWAWHAF